MNSSDILAEPDRPATLLPHLTLSVNRLLRSAESLSDEQFEAPSLLPGWGRAHVLVHLARGAESRMRLLTAARGGADLPQYPDEASRERSIEQGARQDPGSIRSDLESSLNGLLHAIADHPPQAWDVPVRWLGQGRRPVRGVLWSLWRELEVHHVDLAARYNPSDWPAAFVFRELRGIVTQLSDTAAIAPVQIHADEETRRLSTDDHPGPVVQGPAAELLGWLTGRSNGSSLRVDPPGPLPRVPPWKQ